MDLDPKRSALIVQDLQNAALNYTPTNVGERVSTLWAREAGCRGMRSWDEG